MKQLRYFMFVLASLFATGVLAQGMEHPNLGLYDPSAPRDEIRAVLEQVDGSWQSNSPIPQSGGLAQTTTADTGDGVSLLVIGGGIGGALIATNVVRKYDTTSDTWSTVAPLPMPDRAYGSAVRLDGCVYVFGGYDGNNVLNNTFVYHIEGDSWSQGARMPDARFGPAVATDGDDAIWVIGGFGGPPFFDATNTTWKYTPTTDSWTTGFAALPLPLGRIHGAYVPGAGTVHIFADGRAAEPSACKSGRSCYEML